MHVVSGRPAGSAHFADFGCFFYVFTCHDGDFGQMSVERLKAASALDKYMVAVPPGEGIGPGDRACGDGVDGGAKRGGQIHARVAQVEALGYTKSSQGPLCLGFGRTALYGDIRDVTGHFPGGYREAGLWQDDSDGKRETGQIHAQHLLEVQLLYVPAHPEADVVTSFVFFRKPNEELFHKQTIYYTPTIGSLQVARGSRLCYDR